MQNISILKARTEEQPQYFEVTKNDIVGDHPTWAKLSYDPYPNANLEDVVRREIIGRKLVLHAKLKLETLTPPIRPGIALDYGGHKFAVESADMQIQSNPDGSAAGAIVDVEASEFTSLIQPVKVIEDLRKMLAASNPA